jgi:hypothetical protein
MFSFFDESPAPGRSGIEGLSAALKIQIQEAYSAWPRHNACSLHRGDCGKTDRKWSLTLHVSTFNNSCGFVEEEYWSSTTHRSDIIPQCNLIVFFTNPCMSDHLLNAHECQWETSTFTWPSFPF